VSQKALLLLLIPLVLYSTSAISDPALKLVSAARSQIGTTLLYDGSYRTLSYPNGDVSAERGVCSDVVIRALRVSHSFDLQQQLHEDMSRHFSLYPALWSLKRPDRNIDHRRVPNLQTFFKRKGWSLPVTANSADYQPGDIVTSIVPPNLPHIMIVSDKKSLFRRPLVIHNIGAGTQEEDVLFDFKITGHYRITSLN
jgi:uncharacterized protein YijF (DUF1287 family)